MPGTSLGHRSKGKQGSIYATRPDDVAKYICVNFKHIVWVEGLGYSNFWLKLLFYVFKEELHCIREKKREALCVICMLCCFSFNSLCISESISKWNDNDDNPLPFAPKRKGTQWPSNVDISKVELLINWCICPKSKSIGGRNILVVGPSEKKVTHRPHARTLHKDV